jgi:KaiC/GvpD/RAD55 family RecA-like ATPase
LKSKRVKSGIPGLDELMEGGFVPGSIVLVCGKTGTGKTIFCSQYLYKGAMIYNEPGIYITTEETVEDIKGDMLTSFKWDFRELEKKRLIVMCQVRPHEMKKIEEIVLEAADKFKVKRAVIDSTSLFDLYIKDPYKARIKLFDILLKLKERGITTVVTAEIPEDSKSLSRLGIVEFQVDGVIILQFVPFAARYKRSLVVRKMRRTKHSIKIHPLEITPDGLAVVE